MPEFPTEEDRLLHRITTRAMIDASFREMLLKDPGAAIEAATGARIPSTRRIRFVEKPRDVDTFLVLPDFVGPPLELSVAELEAVAGGANLGCGPTTCPTTSVSTTRLDV